MSTMSTKSIKRLTARARNSISMLNPFGDEANDAAQLSHSHLDEDKENDTIHLEEFGVPSGYINISCSASPHPATNRESPTKRQRLMGSLRTMGSLRSLRSTPSKDKSEQSAGSPMQPEGSSTPVREIRPSLTLDFEQSPPDRPMFDLRRKRSLSSSLIVHHSSPLPIPTPVKQHTGSVQDPASPSCLPAGTVPCTPAPLQIALDMDPEELALPRRNPSPASVHEITDSLPTPLPGTHFTFDQSAEIHGHTESKNRRIGSSVERSSYFHFTHGSGVVQNMDPDKHIGLDHTDVQLPQMEAQEVSTTPISIAENSQPDSNLWKQKIGFTGGLSERSLNLRAARIRQELGKGHQTANTNQNRASEQDASDDRSLLDNIRHLNSLVCPGSGENVQGINTEQQTFEDGEQELSGPQDGYNEVRQLRLPIRTKDGRPSACNNLPRRLGHDETAFNENLYDGAGYGEQLSSVTSLPSTLSSSETGTFGYQGEGPGDVQHSSLIEESRPERTSVTRSQNDDAVVGDHETLEDVIRAYASYEDGASVVTGAFAEDVKEDADVGSQAEVELANKVADCSLGA